MNQCALLQINQEDRDIFESGKKKKIRQLPRSKLCRLSSAINAEENLQKQVRWAKWLQCGEIRQERQEEKQKPDF